MYSIIIAIIFYIIGFWLMANETKKDPLNRSAWSYLSAILALVMGVAITLMWLLIIL